LARVERARLDRPTCKFKKSSGDFCRRSVSEREDLCWQHARSWSHRWRSLTRNQAVSFIVAALGLAITVLLAVITFIPRITVTPSDPADPSNPFSASFTITNTSFVPYPLEQCGVMLYPGDISTEPMPFNPPKVYDMDTVIARGFTKKEWMGHTLRMDEKFTITIEDILHLHHQPPYLPTKLSGADIAIVVGFRPWFFPWY